jgi:bacterioferritin
MAARRSLRSAVTLWPRDLRDAIAHCEGVRDYATRELLAEILESEEDGIDFIESQHVLIKKISLENYVQLQSEAAED